MINPAQTRPGGREHPKPDGCRTVRCVSTGEASLKGRAGDLRYHMSKIKRNDKLTPCIPGCDMFLNPPGCLVTLFKRETVP